MLTEVIMKRKLFDSEISQKSKSEFFSATDLVKAGNKWRMLNGLQAFNDSHFFSKKETKEFMASLESKFKEPVRIIARGRGTHTWIHPYLFIDMALAINPELKIEVYGWLFDYLIKYRNESGDSYKRMAGALYTNQGNKQAFPGYIQGVAKKIKIACGVEDWNTASQEQLKMRDKIHDSIYLLSDILKDNDRSVNIAIMKALDVAGEKEIGGRQ